MRRFKSLVCNQRAWILTLFSCNAFSLALGIVVFGLALGTISRDIFVFEVQEILAPVYRVSCANIASGVLLCLTGFVGFSFINYRKNLLGKCYSVLLVVMFTYQLSIGIATLIISNQKITLLRAVTILLCVDPYLKHWEASLDTIADGTMVDLIELSEQYHSNRTARSGSLDQLYAQGIPSTKTVEDCQGFADLVTPCGCLHVVGTALYFLMLLSTIRIRDHDKRHGNRPNNIIRKAFQDGKLVLSFNPKSKLPSPGVVPEISISHVNSQGLEEVEDLQA